MSYAIIRNEKLTRAQAMGAYKHNERKTKNHSNKNINSDEEEAVARFIKKASGRAYKNCSKPARFIIYILTGRKEINIFTKAGN